jgi:translation initiation factor 1A
MPAKNKGKGGKKKRRAGGSNTVVERSVMISDGPQQVYAQATKMLGDSRILANCYDPKQKTWTEKMVHVRGKFRKRVWVNINDFILVSTREFETGPSEDAAGTDTSGIEHGGDIIHIYQVNEIKKLVKMGAFKLPDGGEDIGENEGKGRHRVFVDDSDEDSDIQPNQPLEEDDETKPKVPIIPEQTRYLGMPSSSDDESMDSDDLQTALANL